jgi:hypothetical protein
VLGAVESFCIVVAGDFCALMAMEGHQSLQDVRVQHFPEYLLVFVVFHVLL